MPAPATCVVTIRAFLLALARPAGSSPSRCAGPMARKRSSLAEPPTSGSPCAREGDNHDGRGCTSAQSDRRREVSPCRQRDLVGWVAWYRRPAVPDPPEIPPDLDPIVRATIEKSRAQVLASPRAAPAWGRLGMVLVAHDFPDEGIACLAQAERLD